MRSVFFFSQSGCLLPILLMFNLFFGWLFFAPLIWLSIEGILLVLFFVNSLILLRRISSMTSKVSPGREGAIDVEGEIVEDKRH